MKERIRIGSRVSTKAWQFDNKVADDCDWWSFKAFGEKWSESTILGNTTGNTVTYWLFVGYVPNVWQFRKCHEIWYTI